MFRRQNRPDLADVNIYTARRLSGMARSLSLLAESCEESRDCRGLSREEAAASLQMAAAMVCGDCSRCAFLKEDGEQENYYLSYLLRTFEQKGQIGEADMPRMFQETCGQAEEYVRQLNRNLGRAAMNLSWKNRFLESCDTVVLQFRELALLLEEFALQMQAARDVTAAKEAAVRRAFAGKHVRVENLLLLEFQNGRREACVTARTTDGRCVTAKDAAAVLSRALGGREFLPLRDSRTLFTRQTATLRFAEAGSYRMAYGAASRSKAGEPVSGDSYLYSGSIPGQAVLSLSDGMGSGARAGEESGRVTELVRQLQETGFGARAALKMVNTVLLMSGGGERPATVDLACVDLYTGVMEALKYGAPATFLLGETGAEILSAGQVPAGAIPAAEPALFSRKLWDGERIVMVTDGVLDACPGDDKEETLRLCIEGLPVKGPQEMAEQILRFACREGGARDDMTVLVAGIWKRI